MTTQTYRIRPGDNPHPVLHAHNGENVFGAFLTTEGYEFDIEPDTLEFAPPKGRRQAGITPDIKLLSVPGGLAVDGLYIELTFADLFIRADQLPEATQIKNLTRSASRQRHISPEDYLDRKRAKIDAATAEHDVDIILLTYADQVAILERPQLLRRRLAPCLRRAVSRAAA